MMLLHTERKVSLVRGLVLERLFVTECRRMGNPLLFGYEELGVYSNDLSLVPVTLKFDSSQSITFSGIRCS